MQPNNKNKRTVSFRIQATLLESLTKEAERMGISKNSLLSVILHYRYNVNNTIQ